MGLAMETAADRATPPEETPNKAQLSSSHSPAERPASDTIGSYVVKQASGAAAMLNRLRKPRPHSTSEKSRFVFKIHQDDSIDPRRATRVSIDESPQRTTLTPIHSLYARNMGGTSALQHQQNTSKPLPSLPTSPSAETAPGHGRRMASTIRSVPNHDSRPSFDEDGDSTEWSASGRHSASAFSSSLQSEYSTVSSSSPYTSQTNGGIDSRPNPKTKNSQNTPTAHLAAPNQHQTLKQSSRTPSPDSRGSIEVPRRESSLGVTDQSYSRRNAGISTSTSNGNASKMGRQESSEEGLGWDSTVGKAALSGKTGRVINKLVSDNEALKRDIQIEKLKAEESRQAARLLEDKMERMAAEYESRLLDANITKTLLTKKERKVESLQAAVELEKQRTADARDKERTWREEMDKVRSDSKRTVEQATTHAALMEGRYNAISSHWREQGEEVEKALSRVRKEMAQLLKERALDDDKINTLRELCDQQDINIRELRRQNDAIGQKFAEYKETQEEALRDIKTKAAQREEEQTRQLEEARDVLHKLKWALQVKENVKGAQ
ncbi:hypothetical protein PpBr36_00145 [Pyricularia pennisetigena]|uniref:hypothetical protein n=1 Tax=Pyricularia pennisetigena TaxID=1578925 RepID=UPI00115288A1|nr:hypothetical protein PpBr36_00145 [Pyricularia pennisetigena]TLS29306.1 hypothetical protein PpBr36_00145 [Pyricularia pennisetigena]